MAQVYAAIAAVMSDLAHDGIGKDRKNVQQNYAFRGIDDVLNTLSGILVKNKLIMLPRVLSRECVERLNRSGNPLFYSAVHVEYDLISAEDGSKHTIATYGEAMDSADKSTNKAMSAAYKYAAIQAFCIPTEGDNDADATTHDVAPNANGKQTTEAPANPAEVALDITEALKACQSQEELLTEWNTNAEWIKWLPSELKAAVTKTKDDRKAELSKPRAVA